jgi:hypothetical protein
MTLRAAAQQFTSAEAVRSAQNCGCVNADEPDDDTLEALIDQASDVLVRLSNGRVVGRRTVTVRPCRNGCWDCCPCCNLDSVPLWSPDPVVSEVKIDGVAMSSADYAVHQSRYGFGLVKVGTGLHRPTSWPSWQSLWRPDTEDNTFSITYTYGEHIEWVIEKAAIELVCYFAQQDQLKKNQLQKGAVSANYNATTVTLEERLATARGADRQTAVGSAMEQMFAVYGQGPVSTAWSPELDNGWSFHVIGS